MFRHLAGSLARPVALSPSMGLRRLMTSTWFSRSHPSSSSTSVTERPGGPVPLPLHSHRGRKSPSDDANGKVQEAPLSTSSKTCTQSASTRRWVSRLLASASLATDTRAYSWAFRSSFAGPRFWHRDIAMRRAALWLCSHASPLGRVGRKAGVAWN